VDAAFNVFDCVLLDGTQRGKSWNAILSIPRFAAGAYFSALIAAHQQ
jgi:hypothetical protein